MSKIKIHYDVEQRSDEWFSLRLGKITGSEVHKIMGARGFGGTGDTYVNCKIAEILTGKVHEIPTNYAMQWGIDNEPYARQILQSQKKFQKSDLKEIGFVTNEEFEICGASPDAVILDEKIGFEIKCPENPSNHAAYLQLKTADDLKKLKKEYYYQVMFSLMISEFEKWYFVSFHPDFNARKPLQLHAIEIYPSTNEFNFMQERITEAQEKIYQGLKNVGVIL